jgi:flagellar basal-body rod protein FlgB
VAMMDLNIVTFLKSKMKWHQARQRVLAENVANADSPDYRPQDLVPVSFQESLRRNSPQSMGVIRTHQAHFNANIASSFGSPDSERGTDWEINPSGNAVVLEEQMMKVSENQFDYQMASSIYSRSLGLLRTAIGRKG